MRLTQLLARYLCTTSQLINTVALASRLPVHAVVSPLNIIAGKEPEATLCFLRALAKAAVSPTAAAAVETVLSDEVGVWHQLAVSKRRCLTRCAAALKGSAVRARLRRGSALLEVVVASSVPALKPPQQALSPAHPNQVNCKLSCMHTLTVLYVQTIKHAYLHM